jgi:glycosyltransferase involved in cell wall biosynthesis
LKYPLVSVITPCLNMGRFLEETIQSVLAQDYPRVEYIVMDGGSSDSTLEILEKYRDRLRYESGPDRGAADAINKGFALSKGSIIAWLNADDTYLPGAVSAAVRAFADAPNAGVIYGDGFWVDAAGKNIAPYPTRPFDPELLREECFICQPAAFVRRDVFERAGGMRPGLQVAFDYELWMRIVKLHSLVKIDQCLATSRMHSGSKTLGQRKRLYLEAFQIMSEHFGHVPFRWVYDYACYLIEKRYEFLKPYRPSLRGYLLSLSLGLWYDRRGPWRFLREWFSVMRLGALARWRRSLHISGRRGPGGL